MSAGQVITNLGLKENQLGATVVVNTKQGKVMGEIKPNPIQRFKPVRCEVN